MEIRKLERSFAQGKNEISSNFNLISEHFDLNSVSNVHNASSALKLYFREMIPPLIPYDHFQTWMETTGNTIFS